MLVVFDIDGTLVDSQALIVAAQCATFAAHGLPAPDRETSLSVVGLSLPEAFRTLVGPDGPVDSMAAHYKLAFNRLRADPAHEEPLFPGAAELLCLLARRSDLQLGIATGKTRRGVAYLIERHGWSDVFHTIQTADDAPSKPDPAMLRQAMAQTGRRPDETIMLGDTSYDMAMARAAGAKAIGASWGYHKPAMLEAAGAHGLVDGLPAFGEFVLKRAGAIV